MSRHGDPEIAGSTVVYLPHPYSLTKKHHRSLGIGAAERKAAGLQPIDHNYSRHTAGYDNTFGKRYEHSQSYSRTQVTGHEPLLAERPSHAIESNRHEFNRNPSRSRRDTLEPRASNSPTAPTASNQRHHEHSPSTRVLIQRHVQRQSARTPPIDSQDEPEVINIAVMGGTGVGKSTFINVLAASSDGREKARVGHTLMSCTADVQIFPCTLQGRRFNLIDTPGFDDPRMSDVEILSRLVDYFRTRPIHGVIFLHRITDIRLSGSAIRTAQLIKHICGAEFFERVALVTGMWDVVRDKDREAAHRRLTELRNHDSFWRPFVTGRARSHSFSRRHRSTAEKVIKSFFDQQRKPGYRVQPLAVVSQIKALGTLAKTDAGLYLLRQHSRENNSDSRWSVQKR